MSALGTPAQCTGDLESQQLLGVAGDTGSDAPRWRSRHAAGALAAGLLGSLCLAGLCAAAAGRAAGMDTTRGHVRGLSFDEVGPHGSVAIARQEAKVVGGRASRALNALAAYYRSMRSASRQFHQLAVRGESPGFLGTRAGNSAQHLEGIIESTEHPPVHSDALPPVVLNKSELSAAQRAAITKMINASHGAAEDRHGGSACADDEELFGDLCYRRCSKFDGGRYPFRATPFSCCRAQPCGFFDDYRLSMKACSGYNVAGESHEGACPHAPGGSAWAAGSSTWESATRGAAP